MGSNMPNNEEEVPAKGAAAAAKHPKQIISANVDKAEQSSLLGDTKGGQTYQVMNKAGAYKQADVFLGGNANTPELYTSKIFSVDVHQRERKDPIGHIYFDVAKTDLNTADASPDKPLANDAHKALDSYALQVVDLLNAPGNEKMQIAVVGNASKTGSAELNQKLSEQRALAVSEELIEKVAAIDPKAAQRIVVMNEGRGDTDLKVNTAAEEARNRGVDIIPLTGEWNDPNRTYRITHVQAKDIAPLQAGEGLTINLKGETLNARNAMQNPIPARGAVKLDALPEQPLKIDVTVQNGDDFKILVAESPAKLTYQFNNRNNTVTVVADGRPVAEVAYHTDNGQLRAQDIQIGSVDKSGNVTDIKRDEVGELKKLRADRAALASKIDTDKDGILEENEINAYQKHVNRREHELVQAAERKQGLTGKDDLGIIKHVSAYYSHTEVADDKSNTKGPKMTASLTQYDTMKEAHSQDKLFKELLDKYGVDMNNMPRLAFIEGKDAPATQNVAVAQGVAQEGNGRG